MEKILMTTSSLKKMEDELHKLKGVEMREKLKNLSDAKDKGDISENAEYEIAKEELENHQMKIAKITEMLNRSVLIDEGSIDTTKVGILTKVKLKNLNTNMEQTFSIVPENEINVKEGKISVNTPISKGLLNKSVGDVVEIQVPAGVLKFEVLSIGFYK